MANRYIRDTTITAKIEATYGLDSAPTGAANSMQVSNVNIQPFNAQYVPRDLIRNYFGAPEELIASINKMVSFEVEAVGSGAAGTAPAWAPLARACGLAETLTVTERARYRPITNGQESVTIYVYDSGTLHKYVGARGGLTVALLLDTIPKLKFSFLAIDGGDTAATPSGVTFGAFKVPQVVSDPFTGDLTFGATLSATGVPAFTGGQVYPSNGIEIDFGLKPEFINLLGGQAVEIVDRGVKGRIIVDVTNAQEVAFYQTIKDATLQSLGLLHGTVVGNRFGIFGTKAQIKAPSKEEMQGKRLMGYEAIFTPTAGNDEIDLITSY